MDTPTEDERREGQPRIGVVGRDPGELLAHALAPIPLLLRELFLTGGRRIEDHTLLARGDIEDPEAALGIVSGSGTDERDA